MTLFVRYLKEHGKVIGAYLLFCVIFCIVFVLYRLPLAAVAYPALLCCLPGFLFIFTDFKKTKRGHEELERISKLNAAMINDLPGSGGLLEEDYQRVIRMLQNEVADLEMSSGEKYRDMIEYYTIWAHQIKTPIAAMRLNLQNEDTQVARRLQADLTRIERYVEMVMAFLRLDAPSSDYVFKECALDPIIRQVVKRFSHEFIDRKLGLQYEPIEYDFITDEKWFSFVLEQFLSNALKYTREGRITISMEEPDVLYIKDTGIGIAPEDIPRIFEKGYTGYNGRTDKKASGIGLYLCRRVCDNLGIGISVESKMGEGTAICLHLKQYELRKE